MAPDIKAALKEAKAGIKENNYEQVTKYCKIVLKHDRNNYQALVMFARACQELNKYEDSKKALLLASTVEPDSPVAWQGLATLLDLQPQLSNPAEAVVIYSKLATLVDSGPKHIIFLRKLAAAQEAAGQAEAAAETLFKMLPLVKENDNDKHAEREAAQNIVNLLAPLQHTLTLEKMTHLLSTLESLLSDSVLGNNETNYKLFLSLTYKAGDVPSMLKAATKMSSIFPTAYPLEWIARIFVENHLPWNSSTPTTDSLWDGCSSSISRLLEIYSTSLWGNLALGLQFQAASDLQSAMSHYSMACECSESQFCNTGGQPIIWWRLLLETQKAIKDWSAVETTAARIIGLIMNTNAKWPVGIQESPDNLNNSLQILRAEALMQMGHEKHYTTALAILRKLGSSANVLIVRCLLNSDLKAARLELLALKEEIDSSTYNLLFAKLLYAEGDHDPGKEMLECLLSTNPNNAEALILLGQIHHQAGDNTASLSCLLRAAKLDTSQGKAFLYLGHHYRRAGDKNKACKCYQKAYSMSPVGEEEGAALSDVYRELGDHERNFALLSAATRGGASGSAWAWLRLGLHYLAQHEAQSAISALQRCLQLHHNHRQALESLGDAYLTRGSYVAAQKVHERVLTLDPSAVYPRCQIAKIQLCVGEPLVAVSQFDAILQECTEENLRSVSLLGKAQAHIVLAASNASTNHLDNTLTHCVSALKALDLARELQPNSMSVWKSLGDACSLLHRLPHYLTVDGIRVPGRLVKPNCRADATTRVSQANVLQLATRCYGAALQLNAADATLWHDMGLSFYFQAKCLFKNEGKEKPSLGVSSLMRRASNCFKKSLSLSPLSSETWNSLGIVCVDKSVDNLSLAQHCFIRSVQLKPSPSNWTHLGAFYLVCKEVQLAHQAFRQAQALDPRFVTCWTGQALVAESVQHYDAADLFRHCCTLGVQPESCLGLAHHVMLALADKKKQSPTVMSLAADAMLFYAREHDSDALGLNLAGLCLEEFGMKNTAADLYQTSLTALTQNVSEGDASITKNLMDCVRSNYGRVLTTLGRVQDAAQHLSAITEPDFQTECILALACLKGEDYETGYSKYMSALHWLAQNHHHKAHVLVALACLQYKFKKVQDAKTLLFESCNEGGGCVAGIIALGALGLVEGDATLITAALNELQPHKNTEEASHHVTFLMAAQAIVKGQVKEARNILSRALLCRPQTPELWRLLSWHLLTNEARSATPGGATSKKGAAGVRATEKLSRGIVAAASAATALSQNRTVVSSAVSSSSPISRPTQDGSTRVLGYLQSGRSRKALKEAQRSLLMHPAEPEAWAALVAAAVGKGSKLKGRVTSIAEVWAPRCSEPVRNWLQKVVTAAA